jgi:hypothetical protein
MSSTEAPFSANMRVRIADHDVQLTVRGNSASEFQMHWAEIAENMGTFVESVTLTVAASNASTLNQQQAATPPAPAAVPDGGWNVAPQPAPPAAAAPPAAFQSAVAPACAHGARNPVSKVGAKGPWKAWMCNAPQGGAKCDPVWIKRGSPEWDTFPA